jgi:EpsI family protein
MIAGLGNRYLQALTLILVAQAFLFYTAAHGEKIPVARPLDEFPSQIGRWTLQQTGVVEPEVRDVLKADDLMTRWYVDPSRGGADLFVAYFKTQRTGQSPHSPKNCLPGSGWSPSSTGFVDVTIPGHRETIRINRYIVTKGDSKDVVLYWYQAHNRVIADEFAAKFYLVADSVRYHRSDTALVRIVVPVSGVSEPEAVALAVGFAQSVYPELKSFLPI